MKDNYKDEILSDLAETSGDLFKTLDLFTQDEFNKIPFEDSWTAAQVADHILKSESGIPAVLKGKSKQASRDADEKVREIKSVFLNYDLKMKSPDSVLPSNEKQDKEDISARLKANREELVRLAGSITLEDVFYDFEFPAMGALTGIEWLTFLICHTKRHTQQMKNIADKLK